MWLKIECTLWPHIMIGIINWLSLFAAVGKWSMSPNSTKPMIDHLVTNATIVHSNRRLVTKNVENNNHRDAQQTFLNITSYLKRMQNCASFHIWNLGRHTTIPISNNHFRARSMCCCFCCGLCPGSNTHTLGGPSVLEIQWKEGFPLYKNQTYPAKTVPWKAVHQKQYSSAWSSLE